MRGGEGIGGGEIASPRLTAHFGDCSSLDEDTWHLVYFTRLEHLLVQRAKKNILPTNRTS